MVKGQRTNPLSPLSDLLNDAIKDATQKANSCNTTASRAAIPPGVRKGISLSRAPSLERIPPPGHQKRNMLRFSPAPARR
jgi:hypothetical protein